MNAFDIPLDNSLATPFLEEILGQKLDIGSGVYGYFDPRLIPRLGSDGFFHTPIVLEAMDNYAEELLQVSAFGTDRPNEDVTAAALFSTDSDVSYAPILGYYQGLFAGSVTEPMRRQASSSGGLTTWLLTKLFTTGEIDGVVHMRTSPAGGFEYAVSHTVKEIYAGARTRYYPGQIGDILQDSSVLGHGRYAIVAIPSIVFELRLLQRLCPNLRQTFPVVVGLICGHQKSTHYMESLLWQMGIDPGEVREVDFRSKVPGRRSNAYRTQVLLKSGEVREASNGALIGTDWGHGLFKAQFSDFTEDVFNETADVVFGDAWIDPYVQDSAGTNVVVVRNPHILHVLQSGVKNKDIQLDVLTSAEVMRSQQALIRHNIVERSERLKCIKGLSKGVSEQRWSTPESISLLRKKLQRRRLSLSLASHQIYEEARAADDLPRYRREISKYIQPYTRLQRLLKVSKAMKLGPLEVYHRLKRRDS